MTVDPASDLLGYAVSLLDAVGADFAGVPAHIAGDCLYAAELLEQAGGRPAATAMIDADPRTTLRAVMAALARVDPATFADERVVDAARLTRRALRRLG